MTGLPIGTPQHCPNCSFAEKVASDLSQLNEKLRTTNHQLNYKMRELQKITAAIDKSLAQIKTLLPSKHVRDL